jgi:hypothetical protein
VSLPRYGAPHPVAVLDEVEAVTLDATGRCSDCDGCEPTCGAVLAERRTGGPTFTTADVRQRLGLSDPQPRETAPETAGRSA